MGEAKGPLQETRVVVPVQSAKTGCISAQAVFSWPRQGVC